MSKTDKPVARQEVWGWKAAPFTSPAFNKLWTAFVYSRAWASFMDDGEYAVMRSAHRHIWASTADHCPDSQAETVDMALLVLWLHCIEGTDPHRGNQGSFQMTRSVLGNELFLVVPDCVLTVVTALHQSTDLFSLPVALSYRVAWLYTHVQHAMRCARILDKLRPPEEGCYTQTFVGEFIPLGIPVDT
jgi:hypothetical protein